MKRKIAVIVLTVIYSLSIALGLTACGDRNKNPPTHTHSNVRTEGLVYTLNRDKESYSVTGIGTATDTDIVIASEYNGKPVTSIGNYAFSDCISLTSVTIPNSVTSIGNSAFDGCISLTSVTIPNSVTSIGYRAFSDCNKLQYNKYDSAYYLGNETNQYVVLIKARDIPIPSCVIHENTKFIHSRAFSDCGGLTSVTMPNGVTSIGNYAFDGCISLTSIAIPNSVTSIGNSAFSNCSSLTSVTIPNSVMNIGERAFRACDKLQYNEYDNAYYLGNETNKHLALIKAKDTSITSCMIYENTKFIQSSAFEDCSKLTSITIPNSVTSIGDSAFSYCNSLSEIRYTGDIKNWCEISGLYYLMPYGTSNRKLYINSVEITGNLTIPNGVTSIGNYAFFNCSSLTSITIPNSVTSIGNYAFSGCSSLSEIRYTGDIKSWCEISGLYYLMPYGTSNRKLYINNVELTGNIVIPDSVTSIGSCAFYNCDEFTSITFNGTKVQWKTIPKYIGWDNGTGNYTIICTDGILDKSGNEITDSTL